MTDNLQPVHMRKNLRKFILLEHQCHLADKYSETQY